MDIKQNFIQELINEDIHLSLTNEQRESIAELHEYQLRLHVVSVSLNKLIEQFEKETEMTWFRSPNAFKDWVNER